MTHLMTKFKIHEIIEKKLVINFDIYSLKLWKFHKSKLLLTKSLNVTVYLLNYCLWQLSMLRVMATVGMASSSNGSGMSGWQQHCRRVGDVVGLDPKGSDSGVIIRWRQHVGMTSTSSSGWQCRRTGAEWEWQWRHRWMEATSSSSRQHRKTRVGREWQWRGAANIWGGMGLRVKTTPFFKGRKINK